MLVAIFYHVLDQKRNSLGGSVALVTQDGGGVARVTFERGVSEHAVDGRRELGVGELDEFHLNAEALRLDDDGVERLVEGDRKDDDGRGVVDGLDETVEAAVSDEESDLVVREQVVLRDPGKDLDVLDAGAVFRVAELPDEAVVHERPEGVAEAAGDVLRDVFEEAAE